MSRALILGTVGRKRLISLSPIGVVEGREIFPIRGAEEDTTGNSEDTGSEDDEETDDEETEEDDDEEDEKEPKNKRDRRGKKPADAAFAAMQREIRTLKREKAAREKKDREAELAGKSEVDRVTAERDDVKQELENLRSKYSSTVVELEIIKASHGKFKWADFEDVLNDKKLRTAIEIDDDGEISGVADALKDLAKRKPHFLSKSTEDDDKGKGDKSRNTNNGSSSGKTGGQPGNGGGSGDREADRQALATKYPALSPLIG